MPDLESRLARLEQIALDATHDSQRVENELSRCRDRLHLLEKATEGLVTLQRELHRQNETRLQSLSVRIQWAGLIVAFGMFVLAAVTIVASVHR